MYRAQFYYGKDFVGPIVKIPGDCRRHQNQHACIFYFSDGSTLTYLKRGALTWAEGWAAMSPQNPHRRKLAIKTVGIEYV